MKRVIFLILLVNLTIFLYCQSFGGGTGSSEDPFLIETVGHIFELATQINNHNSNYVNKHFKQIADIDFATYEDEFIWTPVAFYSATGNLSFNSVYDGNNHKIQNFHYNQPGSLSFSFFGVLGEEHGFIKNLILDNISITNQSYVSGLVYINYGVIDNCHIRGVVEGSSSTSGITSSNYGLITNSVNSAEISGGSITGGISRSNYGEIRNCENYGNIVSSGIIIGGITGFNFAGRITESKNYGQISGNAEIGGIIGSGSGIIENCTNTGEIIGLNKLGGIAGNCYKLQIINSDNNVDISGNYEIGGLTGRCIESQITDSYNTGNVNGLGDFGGITGYSMDSSFKNSYYNYEDLLINNLSILTIGGVSAEMFYAWLENDKDLSVDNYLNTQGGNYVVSSVEDLKKLLMFGQFEEYKFILTNDLDLSEEPGFYIPYISSSFNGDNHRIYGFNINIDYSGFVGLFGIVDRSTVCNLSLIDINVNSSYYVGGLVGYNSGVIDNCFVTGNLSFLVNYYSTLGGLVAYNAGTVMNSNVDAVIVGGLIAGGIVGQNKGNNYTFEHDINERKGVIDNCYFSGEITNAIYDAGGIAGNSEGGFILNSFNQGHIYNNSYSGGLIGDAKRVYIENSYNTGNISSYSIAGGLIGLSYLCLIVNSHNTGPVTCSEFAGGILGYYSYDDNEDKDEIINSFYNVETSLINGIQLHAHYALYDNQFTDWLNNDKNLIVDDYFQSNGERYLVNDIEDLKNILGFVYSEAYSFILTNDIDLSDLPSFYIPVFYGDFDGNYKIISNLNLNNNYINIGMFGIVEEGATVSRLGLTNVNVAGYKSVGGFTGKNLGTIDECFVIGSVSGMFNVGGFAGISEGNISNSFVRGNVQCSMHGVGGFVSFAKNPAVISKSYSTTYIDNQSSYTGGFVAAHNYADFIRCFWDVETSGTTQSAGGEGRNTSQMKMVDNFRNWDFDNIWSITENNNGYPFLSGFDYYTTVQDDVIGIDNDLITKLYSAYPNPFNPSTTISFDLDSKSLVTIDLFNVKGQKIKTLLNQTMKSGHHKITWEGTDSNNKKVSSGVYFYKMQTENYTKINKIIMIK